MSTTVKSWVSRLSIGTVARNADETYTVSWIPIGEDREQSIVEMDFDVFPIAYLASLEEAGIAPPVSEMVNR